MSNKKYQIFVSSTYKDLIDKRKEVIECILRMEHFPVGMEMFSAGTSNQWEVIRRTIDQSDYYIVIIGHRYGSIESETKISYTEKEYDYAVSKGIPILAFIQEDDIPLKDSERELNPECQEKLKKFKEKVQNRICEFWKDSKDLISRVPIALHKAFKDYPRNGWIKSSSNIELELNRLKDENNELKRKLSSENLVDIALKINDDECVRLFFPAYIEGKLDIPKLLEESSIPIRLKNILTKEEIEDYNRKINNINPKDIEEYNNAIMKKCLVENYSRPLSFSIFNNGNIKASNIHIELTFPDSVILFEKDNKPEIEIPKNPLPPDILEKAKQKLTNPIPDILNCISGYRNPATVSIVKNSIVFPKITPINCKVYINNNVTIININDLLHTMTRKIDNEIYIYPLQKGNFFIEASIICEQFKERKYFKIPLIIEETQEVYSSSVD